MRRALSLAILLPLVTTCVADAQQPRPDACASAQHREFDFWVGEWEVTDSAGRTVYGTNHVNREEASCLVHENWTGSRGGTGQSLNFYNPMKARWEQVWVGSDGLVLQITGGLHGTSMVLEGEALGQDGKPAKQRATWTPQSDGRVRQFWEQSADGGTTWTVAFDGWYRPKP
jgi:hypothetical protein